ncbi:hypothetical protein HOY82DRAFT_534944 [Tuber indicum]|nr:hypothetical protein HOY82DRAFT_534944 [Tuber indicum]
MAGSPPLLPHIASSDMVCRSDTQQPPIGFYPRDFPPAANILQYCHKASQTDTGPPSTGFYNRIPPPRFPSYSDMATQTIPRLPVDGLSVNGLPVTTFLSPMGPDPPVALYSFIETVNSASKNLPSTGLPSRGPPPPLAPRVARYVEMLARRDNVDPIAAGYAPLVGGVPPPRSAFAEIGASPRVGLASLGIYPRKPSVDRQWKDAIQYWDKMEDDDKQQVSQELLLCRKLARCPKELLSVATYGLTAAGSSSRTVISSDSPVPAFQLAPKLPEFPTCYDGNRNNSDSDSHMPISLRQLMAWKQLNELAEMVCGEHVHESTPRGLIHSGPQEGYIFKWECGSLLWTAKICTHCEFRRMTCAKKFEIPSQKLSPGETPQAQLRVLAVWEGHVCEYIHDLRTCGLLKASWWKNDVDLTGESSGMNTQWRCGVWTPRFVTCDHPVFEKTLIPRSFHIALDVAKTISTLKGEFCAWALAGYGHRENLLRINTVAPCLPEAPNFVDFIRNNGISRQKEEREFVL